MSSGFAFAFAMQQATLNYRFTGSKRLSNRVVYYELH